MKNTFSGLQVQILVQVYIQMVRFLPICIVWCKSYIKLVKVLRFDFFACFGATYRTWCTFTCFGEVFHVLVPTL